MEIKETLARLVPDRMKLSRNQLLGLAAAGVLGMSLAACGNEPAPEEGCNNAGIELFSPDSTTCFLEQPTTQPAQTN